VLTIAEPGSGLQNSLWPFGSCLQEAMLVVPTLVVDCVEFVVACAVPMANVTAAANTTPVAITVWLLQVLIIVSFVSKSSLDFAPGRAAPKA
jgi:hypothetical protein